MPSSDLITTIAFYIAIYLVLEFSVSLFIMLIRLCGSTEVSIVGAQCLAFHSGSWQECRLAHPFCVCMGIHQVFQFLTILQRYSASELTVH